MNCWHHKLTSSPYRPSHAPYVAGPVNTYARAGIEFRHCHAQQPRLKQPTFSKKRRRGTKLAPSSISKGTSSTLQETAALDQLIDLMLGALANREELGKIVAENLLAMDQKFWLRVATRNDSALTQADRQRLQELANTAMRMVDAIVKKSDSQLIDSGRVLQKILAAAADERGEWQVPLPDQKLDAMRKELEANAGALDESLLANAFAWMRKASNDKLDGMVALLQHVLQLYAARALVSRQPGLPPDDAFLEEVLAAHESTWEDRIRQEVAAGGVGQASLLAAVRRKMESVVLTLPNGSYAQRVQAEYLKELEGRAEALLKQGK